MLEASLSFLLVVCQRCTDINVHFKEEDRKCHPERMRHPQQRGLLQVQSIDVGGTALPGLTLETAKEHTRVSCGWPNARDACKARPTIEAGFGKAAPSQPSVATQAN